MLRTTGLTRCEFKQKGEGEADQQVEDHAHHGEVERLPDRLPEDRIREDRPVVLQSGERRVLLDDRAVHQRIADDHDHRKQHQQAEEQRRRGDVEQRHQPLARLVGNHAPLANSGLAFRSHPGWRGPCGAPFHLVVSCLPTLRQRQRDDDRAAGLWTRAYLANSASHCFCVAAAASCAVCCPSNIFCTSTSIWRISSSATGRPTNSFAR